MKQNRNAGGNNNSIISIEDPVISISQIGDINLINSNTVASIDIQGTNEDTPVTIDVLANDIDADGDSLTITSATNGTNGTVFIVNGQIVYTLAANFNGTDSFTYTISDGNGGTGTGTVDVTVGAVNDAPVANDDSAVTNEDTPVTIIVFGNDTDADGDSLTITSATNGTNGTVFIVNG
ncbi:MAG: cadherin-like domain-containing protein, partial [Rickettsiales bacterium]|nr:cadherin-like domain-containing protein [Rickettsiales bacterium]